MKLKKRVKKKNIFTYSQLLDMGLEDTKENRKLHRNGEDIELLLRLPNEKDNTGVNNG